MLVWTNVWRETVTALPIHANTKKDCLTALLELFLRHAPPDTTFIVLTLCAHCKPNKPHDKEIRLSVAVKWYTGEICRKLGSLFLTSWKNHVLKNICVFIAMATTSDLFRKCTTKKYPPFMIVRLAEISMVPTHATVHHSNSFLFCIQIANWKWIACLRNSHKSLLAFSIESQQLYSRELTLCVTAASFSGLSFASLEAVACESRDKPGSTNCSA